MVEDAASGTAEAAAASVTPTTGEPAPPAVAMHTAPELEPGMPAIAAGQALLSRQIAAWRQVEPSVRLGEDPEALHQWRVTGRRLVALLRLLESVPLPGALRLRRRVQALIRRTSAMRDLDVQRTELEAIDRALPGQPLVGVVQSLDARRLRARTALLRLLDSERFRRVLAALDTLAAVTPTRHAEIPLAVVAEAVIRRRHRRVRRQARLVNESTDAESLHQLRLAAKKLRYVLEPLAALYGEPLQHYLRRLQQLQTLLGRHNDACHAIDTLERLAAGRRRLPAAALFAMGRAAQQQHALVLEVRGRLPGALHRISGRRWRDLRNRMTERLADAGPQSGLSCP